MKVKVEGLRELDKAFSELKKVTAKATAKRALTIAAKPMAEKSIGLAPEKTGKLKKSIGITNKAPKGHDAGKNAYSQTMKDGGDSRAAAAAMRAARKANPATFAEVFIVPGATTGNTPREAMPQEFGNVNHGPQAYQRPAFDAEKMNAVETIGGILATEIEKTRKRAAARAAKQLKG